jgi:hypothetical protein
MRSTLVGYLLMMLLGVTIGILIDDRLLQPPPLPPGAAPLAGQGQNLAAPNPAAPNPAAPRPNAPVAVQEQPPAESPPAESPPVGAASGLPKLRVEAARFDFGNLERGEKTEHTFVLRNEGTVPLEISKIHSDHHWIVAEPAALSIPPGQQAELKVKLDPAHEVGRMNGQIAMKTNDPAAPNRHLLIVGNVTTKVKLDPPRIDFGDPGGNEPVSRVFKVTGERGLRFNIEKTQTSNASLAAEVKVVTPGDEYEVTATLDPAGLTAGKFRGWIHLLTDQRGEYHVIPIAVTAGYPVHSHQPAAGAAAGVPQLKLVFPKFRLGDPRQRGQGQGQSRFSHPKHGNRAAGHQVASAQRLLGDGRNLDRLDRARRAGRSDR